MKYISYSEKNFKPFRFITLKYKVRRTYLEVFIVLCFVFLGSFFISSNLVQGIYIEVLRGTEFKMVDARYFVALNNNSYVWESLSCCYFFFSNFFQNETLYPEKGSSRLTNYSHDFKACVWSLCLTLSFIFDHHKYSETFYPIYMYMCATK